MFDPYSSAEQEKANSAVRAGGHGSAGRPALGKSFVLLGSVSSSAKWEVP